MNNKIKTYELSSNLIPIFSGTYNSFWEVREYNDNGEELEVYYDQSDLMYSIVDTYAAWKDDIKQVFNEAIQEKIAIPDFIKDLIFPGSYSSPREYNFKTDVINFDVTISQSKLKKALKILESDKKFHKFLKDNYSSYDGFWSFTPDNFQELKEEIENKGNHLEQSIGALLTYLITNADPYDNPLKVLEMDIYEGWSCNGYNGLIYETNEIEPKFSIGQKVRLISDSIINENDTLIIDDILDADNIDYDSNMLPEGLYILKTEEGYPVNKKFYDSQLELTRPLITQKESLF